MTKNKLERTSPPRPYRLGLRQGSIDEKRQKVIEAARELIMSNRAPAVFSVDAVATAAGVARATIYNQFGSRAGLLEALYDDLARRGGMFELGEVFRIENPLDALGEFVRAFGHFWTIDRILIRRLHGLNTLDAEMAESRCRPQQPAATRLAKNRRQNQRKIRFAKQFAAGGNHRNFANADEFRVFRPARRNDAHAGRSRAIGTEIDFEMVRIAGRFINPKSHISRNSFFRKGCKFNLVAALCPKRVVSGRAQARCSIVYNLA